MMTVYDIGEDGGRWLVTGTTDRGKAISEIIGHLHGQLIPDGTTDLGGEHALFADEVNALIHAPAHVCVNIVFDGRTERAYQGAPAPKTGSPLPDGVEFGALYGITYGCTLPEWGQR